MRDRPLEIEVVQRGRWFTWYVWDGYEIPKMSLWSYPRESWARYFAERAARRYDRRGRPGKERSSTWYTFPQ